LIGHDDHTYFKGYALGDGSYSSEFDPPGTAIPEITAQDAPALFEHCRYGSAVPPFRERPWVRVGRRETLVDVVSADLGPTLAHPLVSLRALLQDTPQRSLSSRRSLLAGFL
jgi:hypothetical protein